MLRALLLTLVGLAVSAHAWAYPLNDGTGTVVWPFEGHGSDSGGLVYPIIGELRVTDLAMSISASLDGVPVGLVGSGQSTISNGEPGSGVDAMSAPILQIGSGVTSRPDVIGHPYGSPFGQQGGLWLSLYVVPAFSDSDGVAFDGAVPSANGFLPPPYAPDVGLFERHDVLIVQLNCETDHDCGILRWYPGYGFTITIDRFIDPVPEPSALALGALALIAVSALRRAARR